MRKIPKLLCLLIFITVLISCSKSSDDNKNSNATLKILYSTKPSSSLPYGDIIVRDLDGNNIEKILFSNNTQSFSTFDWFKKGEKIVYKEYGSRDIYTVNIDGSDIQKIGECDVPVYISPNGDIFAYINYYNSIYSPNGDNHVYTCSLNGDNNKKIIAAVPNHTVLDISWSNDGNTIIYALYSNGESGLTNTMICTVSPDGSNPKIIFNSKNPDLIAENPRISPNGKKICYIINSKELVVCDLNGENAKTIFTMQYGLVKNAYWMPDGESIMMSILESLDAAYYAATIGIGGNDYKQYIDIRGENFKPALVK